MTDAASDKRCDPDASSHSANRAYHRTLRFADTDAAGVVYFAALLSICHEAYEDALIQAGVELRSFFAGERLSGADAEPTPAIVPIVQAEIDFRRPLYCGEAVRIELFWQAETSDDRPTPALATEFSVVYTIVHNQSGKVAARARTRHVCIDRQTRQRLALPPQLQCLLPDRPPR